MGRTKSKLKISSFNAPGNAEDFMFSNQDAAISCAKMMDVDLASVSFDQFPGMERRQSILFENCNRTIVEDYAHHPTEIRSLAAEELMPEHWMKVVFQSHRYSRTKAFAKSFAEELGMADELNLLPTYGAFEDYDEGGDAESLIGYLPPRLRNKTKVFADFPSFMEENFKMKRLGVLIKFFFVGAGNLDNWAHAFAAIHSQRGDMVSSFAHFLEKEFPKLYTSKR